MSFKRVQGERCANRASERLFPITMNIMETGVTKRDGMSISHPLLQRRMFVCVRIRSTSVHILLADHRVVLCLIQSQPLKCQCQCKCLEPSDSDDWACGLPRMGSFFLEVPYAPYIPRVVALQKLSRAASPLPLPLPLVLSPSRKGPPFRTLHISITSARRK